VSNLLPIVGLLISALSIAFVLGYRGMTAKEKIFGSLFGLGWAAAGTYVWQVAAPSYSEGTKPKIVLFWLIVGSGLLVWWIAETRARKMALWQFLLLGAGLGALSGAVVWIMFYTAEPPSVANAAETTPDVPDKDSDPTALIIRAGSVDQTIAASPLIPDPNQKPASPDDLEFYFFAYISSATADHIQYANVTVTNRSPRKMHLEIWAHVDFWSDSGEPQRHGWKAEWNPDGFKVNSGDTFIDLDAWETKKGRLMIFIGDPPKEKISRWFVESTENVYLDIFDSVSGKRIAFNPAKGYPSGQIPAPLPSHKQMLALDFPELGIGGSPLPKIDAIVRTRDLTYSDTNAGVDALIKNSSPEPMELEASLLIRSHADVTVWGEVPGVFKEKTENGPQESTVVSIKAGDTVVRRIVFDLAPVGYEAKKGWQLSESPQDTLLQITDRKTGVKVWGAIRAGYPPGGDMRAATVVQNPQPNSTKPKQDTSKDSK
jgi:hypothetical protein